MKRNILIFFTIIGSLLMTACEDIIDKEPLSSVSEELAFQTIEDFDAAVVGVYDIIGKGFSGYARFTNLELPSALSDNLEITSAGRSSFSTTNIYDLAYTPIESVFQSGLVWADIYTGIARANLVLRNIEGFTGGTEAQRNNAKGEALALRGMLHFDLIRVFSKDITANPDALGVPYMTRITQDKVSRDELSKVYELAIKDLEEGAKLIDDSHNSFRLSKTGVQAILSRLYLFKSDYANCIAAAKKAISYGKNSVASIDDYAKIWTDEDAEMNGEVVLRMRYVKGDKKDPANGTVFYAPFMGYIFNATDELINLYDQENDIRFATTLKADDANPGKFGIEKFPGRNELIKYPSYPMRANDAKIIRMSEVYLNLAEAILKSADGVESEALAALNEVRSNRIKDFVSPNESGEALKTAVANERRKELAFEGIRFYDIKRQGIPLTRNGVEILPANDPKFALPLPYEETQKNENLEQNKY